MVVMLSRAFDDSSRDAANLSQHPIYVVMLSRAFDDSSRDAVGKRP